MIEVNIYKPIDREDPFMSFFGFEDEVFSGDTIHKVFDSNPNETEFKFNINCDGGDVHEGLRVYDILRTSKKTLYTNIEGSCHSMAISVLLAAPFENRTANPNARSLIHQARGGGMNGLTSEEAQTLSDQLKVEQDSILDIYADRTTKPREELETLMKEEKFRNMTELLEWGFISKVNTYSTNSVINNLNNKKMEKEQIKKMQTDIETQGTVIKNIWDKFKNFVVPEIKNLNVNAEDGTEIELTGEVLEVGAKTVSPEAGTFTVIMDGKTWTVTIEANEVTAMVEKAKEPTDDTLKTENESLKQELADLKASNLEIENKHKENEVLVNKLRGIQGQFMNEDGSVNFDNIKNLGKAPVTTIAETESEIRDRYKARREAKKNK